MLQPASAGLVLETTAATRSAQNARSVSTVVVSREMRAPPARPSSLDRSRSPPNERARQTACAGERVNLVDNEENMSQTNSLRSAQDDVHQR